MNTLTAPTGLGTSAFRIHPVPHTEGLYCPPPVRDDPALGEEVNDRLVDWAAEIGIYPGLSEELRACQFGRLIMLAHPATSDPDRLLAAAKMGLALWSTDDHLLDEEQLGADPATLGSRLTVVAAAVDPAHLPLAYAPQLEQALRDEPVAMAYRSALQHLSLYATRSQMARIRHETITMFMAYNQEAEWIRTGRRPPVWEYLTHRHFNGFLPCIVQVDTVAGYELSPHDYADQRVRRVFTMAGSAAVLANDLYSRGRESDTDNDLPKLIAHEDRCTEDEAVQRSIDLHNELMHAIEAESAVLSRFGSPQLRRALSDVWAWLGGGHEWHATSGRYHKGANT
ncbi:family 2 encapsulin nanocompartment cargo protein terpene cyclase [Allorhizocola rhizosphaerae]|uniref:family 2 encapsulin nanocompartment cargo protein terpene cyclase n=1 Tax=Allorhizocola rhizosphaerae TaxID=1872709 RepID=UPI000E3D705B|nr:family 2 encapsulin nanocompartment cargo protein terpene cyclase [Allorhizocola rhizosphaerae]